MSGKGPEGEDRGSLSTFERVVERCDRFEAAWKAGQQPQIEQYLEGVAEPEKVALLRELLGLELELRSRSGERPTAEEYQTRFPDYGALIDTALSEVGLASSQTPLPEVGPVSRQEQGWHETEDPRLPTVSYQDTGRSGRVSETESVSKDVGAWVAGGLYPGQIILDGRYRVEQFLDRGAMGEVWLIRHLGLNRRQALKLIQPSYAIHPLALHRFKREAEVMATLDHPNIVRVYDADATPTSAYILMEYVPGRSLNKLLQPSVSMPLEWTASILEQLCDALQEAHDKGIVHRDLKPSNLMLAEGRPPGKDLKVVDFGLAKILASVSSETGPYDTTSSNLKIANESDATLAGQFLGTASYASPEQAAGEPLDRRSDLYAVGVMLYEFLTGYRPFAGDVERLRHDHRHTPPLRLAERNPGIQVLPEVEQVVLRCLAKDPAERYQTARELAESFTKAISTKQPASVTTAPSLSNEQIIRFARVGLDALNELMRTPAVRDAVTSFKNTFQIAREQLRVLSKYKSLHDLLHNLQFHCHNLIVHEMKRFPDDEARSNLEDHELTLQNIIENLQETAERPPFVADETMWIRDLIRAREELRRALDGSEPIRLKLATRLVNKVLAVQPSRINMRLNDAAKNLQLPALVRAMATVHDEVMGLDLDPEKLRQFERGVEAFDSMNQSLNSLVGDHDKWQVVDDELRWIEALLDVDTSDLEICWPNLKAMAEPLYSGNTDGWCAKLKAAAERLDRAITARDPVKIRDGFRLFRRQAGDRFYRVDLALKNLCEELRKIGEPLALVLETIS